MEKIADKAAVRKCRCGRDGCPMWIAHIPKFDPEGKPMGALYAPVPSWEGAHELVGAFNR